VPHWSEDTLVALDLETTGLDPLADRIVQAAVVLVAADGAVLGTSWDGIVDPGIPIPQGASNIHGITTERAQLEGMVPIDALQRIASVLNPAIGDGIPLVIYNAPFDWPFVLAEARRHGVSLVTPQIIDPLVIDRAMDRYRRGSRKLEVVAAHYGFDLSQAHDARADAIAAVAIARALGGQYPEVADVTQQALQPLQARWCREHAESLSRHLGKPIDPGWPLPTNAEHLA
jgi:DNA polymerase-3 subunit epsilon